MGFNVGARRLLAFTRIKAKLAAPAVPSRRVKARLASTNRDQELISQKQPVNWTTRLLLAGGGLALATYIGVYANSLKSPSTTSNQDLYTPKLPRISLGGPFSLITHDGKLVTEKDFLGKWVLIYFGYTHCPEDCPKQLQMITEVVKAFEKLGQEIVPVFISIDPARDNVNQIKMYLNEFHPKFVGLTGTEADIKSAVWRFRVYFKKTAEEDATDYLVDHSNNIYIMNTKMECVRCCGPDYSLDGLIDAVVTEMKMSSQETA